MNISNKLKSGCQKKKPHIYFLLGLSFLFIDAHASISLLTRSPFQQFQPSNEPQPNLIKQGISTLGDELEFCGSNSFGSTRKFSIFAKKEGRTYWLTLNEKISGFRLIKYNNEARTILVESEGKFDLLPLREVSQVANKKPLQRNRITPRKKQQTEKSSRASRRRINPTELRPPGVIPQKPVFPKLLPKKKPERV